MGARRLAGAGIGMAATVAALAPSAAQGLTLGSASRPQGADEVVCPGIDDLVGRQAGETTTSWTVPSHGLLTSWSTNVADADPGRSASLVVIRSVGSELRIAAVDAAALPSPPADGIATFRPATPIAVEPGDRLGVSGTQGATCGWENGPLPSEQRAEVLLAAPQIAPGAVLSSWIAPDPGTQINLAAELLEATDLRVSATAGPAIAAPGGLAQLSGIVSNAGPAASAVTISDTIPAGLTIQTAVVGDGRCTVAGQQVSCTIPSLAPGASAPVVVLVTPTAPGGYANTLTAQPALELTPADNSASATLTVAAPPSGDDGRRTGGDGAGRDRILAPAPRCVVPSLARTPLAVARGLLRQLDCTSGPVTKQRSARVPKGAVIATRPGRGLYRAGRAVRLVVSSGKPVRRPARRASTRARGR